MKKIDQVLNAVRIARAQILPPVKEEENTRKKAKKMVPVRSEKEQRLPANVLPQTV